MFCGLACNKLNPEQLLLSAVAEAAITILLIYTACMSASDVRGSMSRLHFMSETVLWGTKALA